jgi:hypothetical protein
MKNILLSNFNSVFSLEAFLLEVNLKLSNSIDEERLKNVLKNLNMVLVAFDFDFSGPFRSYIDKRYSFEQLLFLCLIKINESKLFIHENHMFKLQSKYGVPPPPLNLKDVSIAQKDLEKKLLATENMSLCYLLSKTHDGVYWRELHELIGSSIMKYILIYGFVFRRIKNNNSSNMFVQISGCKLNSVYRTLIAKKLKEEEKILLEKSKTKSSKIIKKITVEKNEKENIAPNESNNQIKSKNFKNLKMIFDQKDEELLNELYDTKSPEYQIKKMGHTPLNKTLILYDRNLASKIRLKFLYSNSKKSLDLKAAKSIVDNFILKKIHFDSYKEIAHLNEMRASLSETVLKFMELYRSCPFFIFLNYFCRNKRKSLNVKSKLEFFLRECESHWKSF